MPFRVRSTPGSPSRAVGYDVFTRAIVDYEMCKDDPQMRRAFCDFGITDLNHPREFRLGPGETACLGIGVVIEIPDGFAGWIKPRGSTIKNKIAVLDSDVPIDPDFRGEPIATIRNDGNLPFFINRHDRIVQIVFTPVALPILRPVPSLGETARGNGSHGSTGQ